ncbi:uncharacterized protein BDV17DRAFT_291872 [Aspergillus undulatus]|uniref:uncharacterized protein n=1 Tax=Aspergillus undulatus TaxID=1810928 RepID=UPI003CCD8D57
MAAHGSEQYGSPRLALALPAGLLGRGRVQQDRNRPDLPKKWNICANALDASGFCRAESLCRETTARNDAVGSGWTRRWRRVGVEQLGVSRRHLDNETTYFVSSSLGKTVNTTGTWEFLWRLHWHNCSASEDSEYYEEVYPWVNVGDDFNVDRVYEDFHRSEYNVLAERLVFTIREGGSQPNLTTNH